MIIDEDIYLEQDKRTTNQEVEVFLEHFGVKGMRWGVITERRANNRALNKASRARDKASPPKYIAPPKKLPLFSKEAKRSIDKARDNIKSGKTAHDYKTAKFQYKKDKLELGSREARKTLKKAKAKKFSTYETARQTRDGGEYVMKMFNNIANDLNRERERNIANARAQSRSQANRRV